jgi:hypothetical protein
MKNKKNIKQIRSLQEWEEQVERYFDALTTEAEEQELKDFLCSPEAVGAIFDEARAVMGFLKVGQTLYPKKQKHHSVNYWKAAAIFCGVLLGGTALWSTWNKMQNVCEVYIYGTKHTEVAMVMSQMQESLDKMNDVEEDIVEAQLSDFFQMMEDK